MWSALEPEPEAKNNRFCTGRFRFLRFPGTFGGSHVPLWKKAQFRPRKCVGEATFRPPVEEAMFRPADAKLVWRKLRSAP